MVITKKISFDIPVLYDLLIFDEFVEKEKVRSRTDFLLKAITEKFEREGIRYKPKEAGKSYDSVKDIPLEA